MDISIVQGQALTEYKPLDPEWKQEVFTDLKIATDFAMEHGWTAKPQKVQLRRIADGTFIVERFDTTGCGCGG